MWKVIRTIRNLFSGRERNVKREKPLIYSLSLFLSSLLSRTCYLFVHTLRMVVERFNKKKRRTKERRKQKQNTNRDRLPLVVHPLRGVLRSKGPRIAHLEYETFRAGISLINGMRDLLSLVFLLRTRTHTHTHMYVCIFCANFDSLWHRVVSHWLFLVGNEERPEKSK